MLFECEAKKIKQKKNIDEGDLLFQLVPRLCQRNFSAETYIV